MASIIDIRWIGEMPLLTQSQIDFLNLSKSSNCFDGEIPVEPVGGFGP